VNQKICSYVVGPPGSGNLVGLLDDLEVTAFLARPIEDHGQALTVALQGHDGDPLDLVTDLEGCGSALLAQTEDVLISAWPAVAHQERQDGFGPLASIDSQAEGELRVAAPFEHPDSNVGNPADGHSHHYCPGAANDPT